MLGPQLRIGRKLVGVVRVVRGKGRRRRGRRLGHGVGEGSFHQEARKTCAARRRQITPRLLNERAAFRRSKVADRVPFKIYKISERRPQRKRLARPRRGRGDDAVQQERYRDQQHEPHSASWGSGPGVKTSLSSISSRLSAKCACCCGDSASQPKAAGFGGGGCVPLRMALMIASRCASCALLKCSGSKPVTRGSLEPSRKGGGAGRMPILISCFCSGGVSPVFCFFSGGGLASAKSAI
mmetsp:Transcript_18029/g.51437  ORF Transcript_18029/g.51437 Transcript_18029/m.51437 type:complete len:239 (+) Transcript_18029:595-1311(+)